MLADVRLQREAPADEVILFWATAGLTVVAPLPGDIYRIVAPVADAPENPSAAFVQQLLDERGPGPGRIGRHGRRSGAPGSASTIGSPTRTAPAGCCWPATPPTCTARPAGRA